MGKRFVNRFPVGMKPNIFYIIWFVPMNCIRLKSFCRYNDAGEPCPSQGSHDYQCSNCHEPKDIRPACWTDYSHLDIIENPKRFIIKVGLTQNFDWCYYSYSKGKYFRGIDSHIPFNICRYSDATAEMLFDIEKEYIDGLKDYRLPRKTEWFALYDANLLAGSRPIQDEHSPSKSFVELYDNFINRMNSEPVTCHDKVLQMIHQYYTTRLVSAP